MAETLGSLIDKFSIASIRYSSAQDRKVSCQTEEEEIQWDNVISSVYAQKESLKEEVNIFIAEAIRGNVQLSEPKYKIYKGENSSGQKFNNLAEAMEKLFETNKMLWNLEDLRRDKTKSDSEIRIICDDVAKYNRIRNDTIDQINSFLTVLVNQK